MSEQKKQLQLRIIIVIAIVVIVVVGLYAFKAYRNRVNQPHFVPHAVIVPFVTVKKETWHQHIMAIGTVSAKHGVMLQADVAGRITKVLVKSGQAVKAGQALFEINPSILKAQVAAQKAQLALSQHRYERMKKLHQDHAVSEQTYDQARYQYQADVADLKQSEQQLALHIIRAPFAGVFGLTQAHLGDYVAVGDQLGSLQSLKGGLRVDFAVPARYRHAIAVGDRVMLQIPNSPSPTLNGHVYAINSGINPQTRMIAMRAHVTAATLAPGMFVEVTLCLAPAESVLVVPQTAVRRSIQGDYLYQVVKGKAKKVIVDAGLRRGDLMVIKRGLKAGDVIVAGGQNKVLPGAPVTDKGALTLKTGS